MPPIERRRSEQGARLEKQQIIRVLEATGFHQAKAAEILGINRRTLYRKIRELGLKPPE